MTLTLNQLNTAPLPVAMQLLDGLYEHSPWIAEAALQQRPFKSVHQLKYLMTEVLAPWSAKASPPNRPTSKTRPD